MSNAEIQQYLGAQYAEMLKENKETAAIYKDCEEIIQGSLTLLEHYNKIRLGLSQKTTQRVLGS